MTAAIEVDQEVSIRRDLAEVFAFVSDGERLPAWMAGVKRARRTSPPGPLGPGTTYQVVGKLLGRAVKSTYEITAYQPDSSFSAHLLSPYFSVEDTYRFEHVDGATVVHRTASATALGRLRLLGPVLGLAMQRQVKNDHKRLRTVLERARRRVPVGPSAEAPPPPPPPPPDADARPEAEAG